VVGGAAAAGGAGLVQAELGMVITVVWAAAADASMTKTIMIRLRIPPPASPGILGRVDKGILRQAMM
jgi:hypothetical protein